MKNNTLKCPSCSQVFKLGDLTIKKLTKGNPTMNEKFKIFFID